MNPTRSLKGEILKHKRALSIIIWFHIIGLIGLSIPFSNPLFLSLVPFHLLLMLVVILFSHKRTGKRFFFFVLLISALGYLAEWLGVHRYWLFGNYQYGKTLGFKILDVPLIIGLNWFLLIYSAGVLMQRCRLKSKLWRILCGAILLVLLDLLIEPVADRFDYWHWANDIIPIKNYVCWFLISGFMLFLFEQFNFKKQSMVAPILFTAQFIFFGILCLVQVIFLP